MLLVFSNGFAAPINIVTEVNRPLQFVELGESLGFAVEVVEKVLEQGELEGNITFYPWARAYKIAKEEPNTLIFSIRRTPKRETSFIWTQPLFVEPYYPQIEIARAGTHLTLICRHDARIKSDTKQSLARYSIAATRDDFVTEQLIESVNWPTHSIIETVELVDAIDLVLKGRTDLVLAIGNDISVLLSRYGFDPTQFKICYQEPMPHYDLYFAFSLGTDQSHQKAFKTSFNVLIESGEYELIYKKWFSELQ